MSLEKDGALDYYVQTFPEVRREVEERRPYEGLREQLRALAARIEPGWLAFMNSLGRPFHPFLFWDNTGPQAFQPEELPFTRRIGTRGSVLTLEGEFQGESAWDPGLLDDLLLLSRLELGTCFRGACSSPVHPFLCELVSDRRPLTGADVLSALKARDFASEHIRTLDAAEIPYPRYQPCTVNDEVHTDFAGQYIFGRVWYVLLHAGGAVLIWAMPK